MQIPFVRFFALIFLIVQEQYQQVCFFDGEGGWFFGMTYQLQFLLFPHLHLYACITVQFVVLVALWLY